MGKETVDNWTPIVTTWAIHTYIFGDGRVGVYGIGATSDYIAVQPGYQIRNDGPATGRNDETLNMYVHEYTGTTWKKRTQLRPNGGSICTISDGTDNIRLTFAYSADSGMTLRQEDIETYAKPKQLGSECMTELMRRRRALMAAKKSGRLPAEYQEVEYLTSEDVQENRYVNTQIDVMSANKVVMRYSKESDKHGIIVATYFEGNLTLPFGAMSNNMGGRGWDCSPVIARETLVDKANLTFTRTRTGEGTVALMGWTAKSNVPKGKLYSATIYDANDEIIANLVPCYREADTAIGLYDTVNQRFCQQTGGIGKGPDVT